MHRRSIGAEVINVSIGGVLCDLKYNKKYTDLLNGTLLSLEFPSEYNNVKIKNLSCKILRLNVTAWGNDRFPKRIRGVWQFVETSDSNRKALEQIFDTYRKISISEKQWE